MLTNRRLSWSLTLIVNNGNINATCNATWQWLQFLNVVYLQFSTLPSGFCFLPYIKNSISEFPRDPWYPHRVRHCYLICCDWHSIMILSVLNAPAPYVQCICAGFAAHQPNTKNLMETVSPGKMTACLTLVWWLNLKIPLAEWHIWYFI